MALYEAATRIDRKRFPELPTDLPEGDEIIRFMRLNRIILKACHKDRAQRYQSAAEMRKALLTIET
jgi:hypothetical protein